MKKFLFAAVCTMTLVGYVVADEFTAVITKVDGKNISYFKTEAGKGGKGGGGKKGGGGAKKIGDEQKAVAADGIKVSKGMFDADTKAFKAGDALEGGLTNEMFKSIDAEKGVGVTITIADTGADKGKITSIVTKGGKKKGG
jgi:hypothetical protein